jgi:hypothetical protein
MEEEAMGPPVVASQSWEPEVRARLWMEPSKVERRTDLRG